MSWFDPLRAGVLFLAPLVGDGPEVRFEVRDVTGGGSSGVPVTLSALFAPGLFHDDDVSAVVADGPGGAPAVVATQVDVLSHHGDGSLQHALVTLRMDVKPHATHRLFLVPSPQTAAAGPFEAAAPDAPVLVELVDRRGAHWTATLAPPPPEARVDGGQRAGDDGRTGPLFGPLAQEVERRSALRGAKSELANVEVRVRWRRLSGVAATRVDVAVENCPAPRAPAAPSDAGPGPAPDDVEFAELAIFAGDVPLADLKEGVLFDGSRCVVRGYVGAAPPRLMVREDPVELTRAGFLPPYDFTRPLSDAQAGEQIRRIVASDMNGDLAPGEFPLGIPLDPGPIVRYMPATGDRGDIGPLPSWGVLALNSRSVLAEDALLAADFCGAAAFPIHRRTINGTMGDGTMGIDFAAAAPLEKREHRVKCPLAPDRAHAPLLGYVAFLLTGDVFAQEELAAQAAYCFYDWPHDGNYRYPGSRDFAWSLRTTMLAAKVLPDADPLKRYLLERMRSNLKGMRGALLECGQPLHQWGDGGFESSGRKTWPCATQKSPWQGAWVVAALDWTARLHAGDAAAADARSLYEWLAEYYTRAYTSIGESWTAPDGTKVVWANGHHALAYSFPAATYQPQWIGGEWKAKPESMKSIGSFSEALWWLRVNLDHAFEPGKPPKLPPGPDGVATLAPQAWLPAAGYAPPPIPSPGWIEYSMHWLATVLEAEGTKGGHAVYVAVRPAIESQVPLAGLRMTPELWKK